MAHRIRRGRSRMSGGFPASAALNNPLIERMFLTWWSLWTVSNHLIGYQIG